MDFLSPLLAYVAGVVTILNPCVLPVLPIVLATALREGKFGPVALTVGLSMTFTTVFLIASVVGWILAPDSSGDLTSIAVGSGGASAGFDVQSFFVVVGGLLLIALGLTQVLPQGQALINGMTGWMQSGANTLLDSVKLGGLGGQFLVGAILGLAWSPCIGPTLGATTSLTFGAGSFALILLIALMFSFGVSTVLLALSYGSRQLISERRQALMASSAWIKPVTGAILILVGLLLVTGGFKVIETWILNTSPQWIQGLIGVSTSF